MTAPSSRQDKYSKRLFQFEFATIFISSLILLGHYSVIKYAEGYYDYFDIQLHEIAFTPKIYDYVNVAPAVLIASLLITFAFFMLIQLSRFLGDALAKKTKISEKTHTFFNKHRKILARIVVKLGLLLTFITWIFLAIALFRSVDNISTRLGESFARQRVEFGSVSSRDDEVQKLILYKNNDEVILKLYDSSKNQFINGYESSRLGEYSVQRIHLQFKQ